MSGGEQHRLAALERTLVAAASRQAKRRRRRRWQAVALTAIAGPLVLAVAGSLAGGTRFFAAVDQHLSALRDDRLAASPRTAALFASAAGAGPRDRQSGRAWMIAGHRVIGYTTAAGSFCFRFGDLTGGCLQKDTLTRRLPLDVSTDNAPGVFRVYGLAMDGVVGVSLRTRGLTRHATVARNAFFLEENTLGSGRGFTGTLIVRFQNAATLHVPLRVGGVAMPVPSPLPRLPGSLPVGDAAA